MLLTSPHCTQVSRIIIITIIVIMVTHIVTIIAFIITTIINGKGFRPTQVKPDSLKHTLCHAFDSTLWVKYIQLIGSPFPCKDKTFHCHRCHCHCHGHCAVDCHHYFHGLHRHQACRCVSHSQCEWVTVIVIIIVIRIIPIVDKIITTMVIRPAEVCLPFAVREYSWRVSLSFSSASSPSST